jgi:hypothetical protein
VKNNNPVIIVGAGASKGYVSPILVPDSFRYFPLTNELLENKNYHRHDLSRTHNVGGLIADLAQTMSGRALSLENALGYLAPRYSSLNLKTQLLKFRRYLHDLFVDLSSPNYFIPGNNYSSLINIIEKSGHSGATFVSFNYDDLLEQTIWQMTNQNWTTMSDYISGDFKVIKPHGSINWYFFHRKPYDGATVAYDNGVGPWLEEEFPRGQEVYTSEEIANAEKRNEFDKCILYKLPAIAIPITGKDNVLCRENHVRTLETSLAATSKLLIIGWKGADPWLIEKIKDNLNPSAEIMIVNKEGRNIFGSDFPQHNTQILTGGFSENMISGTISDFLAGESRNPMDRLFVGS